MRTFKLKQKYPSLPNDWEVGMEIGLGDRNYGYSPCAGNYRDVKLDNKEVVDNPEFWEEVIDKSYEIIEFFNKDNEMFYRLFKDGKYKPVYGKIGLSNLGDKTLDYCIKYCDIFVVKNLKTKEIIKIGDRVNHKVNINSHGYHLNVETIKEFTNGILINDSYKLEYITLARIPLFTTNDGIEIFEGDTYWFIYPQFTIGHVEKANGIMNGSLGTFSTEIGAKNYKTENEKKYSLNNIKETIKKLDCFDSTLIEYLEKN